MRAGLFVLLVSEADAAVLGLAKWSKTSVDVPSTALAIFALFNEVFDRLALHFDSHAADAFVEASANLVLASVHVPLAALAVTLALHEVVVA